MLVPCGTCGVHLRPGDRCPDCGEARRGPTGAALLLGLALVSACGTSQPLYGTSVTDTVPTDTGADDTGGDTGATSR